jgi:protoheme IX farnesyltransferase
MSTESHSIAPTKVEVLSQPLVEQVDDQDNIATLLAAYLELTKPRILVLLLLIALAGFGMAVQNWYNILVLHLIVGISLIGAATGTLNQWWEQATDAEMRRTQNRPLPANRISSTKAFLFGFVSSILGVGYLAYFINPLSGLIGLFTVVSYLLFYTPLKRKTTLSTVIGAFPGATPPLIGWVAVHNQIDVAGAVLFLIMFLWQFPHFLAIAWMYREDYDRAGIRMLPIVEPSGFVTGRQILLYALVLLPVSLLPTIIGIAGNIYFVGALILSSWYLYCSFLTAKECSWQKARYLLQVSVIYLPLLFILMLLDRIAH